MEQFKGGTHEHEFPLSLKRTSVSKWEMATTSMRCILVIFLAAVCCQCQSDNPGGSSSWAISKFLKVGQFLELRDTMKTGSRLLALAIFTLFVLMKSGNAEIKKNSRKFILVFLNLIAKLKSSFCLFLLLLTSRNSSAEAANQI